MREIFKKHGFDFDKINIAHFGFTESTPLEEVEKVLNLVHLQSDMNMEDLERTKKGTK